MRCSVAGLMACLLLTSCHQQYQPHTTLAKSQSIHAKQSVGYTHWWCAIEDVTLHNIIDTAKLHNLTIAQAKARIDQAQAITKQARAALLPANTTNGSITANNVSREGIQGFNPFIIRSYGQYNLSHTASWEIDLFGRLRNARTSALAQLNESILNELATELSLTASISKTYAQYRSIQQQQRINNKLLAIEKRNLQLANARFQAGIIDISSVNTSKAAINTLKSTNNELAFQLSQSEIRLTLLAGLPANTLHNLLKKKQPIPETPQNFAYGIPADLLQSRPDILASKQRLIAAEANTRIAKAEYFPKITLIGTIGFEALKANNLLSNNAKYLTAGPSFSWRLLDFWRIDDEIAQQQGQQKEKLAQYKETVLNAIAEVETALVDYEKTQKIANKRTATLRIKQNDMTLMRDRYRAGIIALDSVNQAKKALYQAQSSVIEAQLNSLLAYIELNTALGHR